MPIDDRNISTAADFTRETVSLDASGGASLAGVRVDGKRMAFAGKIVSAHLYTATLTDADASVRVDLHKNAASVLSATTNPGAADSAVSMAGAAGTTFAAGDIYKTVLTTGVGDAIVGSVTLIVRPLLQNEAGAR